LRHQVDVSLERAASIVPKPSIAATNGSVKASMDTADRAIPRQLDTGTLLAILAAEPRNLKLVIGHSKGSLMIDYVLDQFVRHLDGKRHRYYEDLNVVTVSAVVGIPKVFKKTRQIIGKMDWFGGMNSLPDLLLSRDEHVRPTFVDNAWHHLNPAYRYALPLQDALAEHVRLS
jgi:hypothetical protein